MCDAIQALSKFSGLHRCLAHHVRCYSACKLRHVPLLRRCFSEVGRDLGTWPQLHVLNDGV